MGMINQEKLLDCFENKLKESLSNKNYQEVSIWAQSMCLIDQQELENVAQWKVWSGWKSNHDYRIEDAICTKCGYKHPVVRGNSSPELLAKKCPKCGALIIGLLETP